MRTYSKEKVNNAAVFNFFVGVFERRKQRVPGENKEPVGRELRMDTEVF